MEIGSRYFRIGKGLKKALGNVQPPPRIAYLCVGLVGFYSELPLVDTYGLVNRNIARKPLKKRGRPGHEKRASLAEVIKEGAVLSYERYAPKGMNRYLEVKLGGTGLFLLDDLESTKSRLKGAKVSRWPRSVNAEVVRATSLGDRSRLVDLTNLGARLLAPPLRRNLKNELGLVDDFESSLDPWSITGPSPRQLKTRLLGMTGKKALHLDGQADRRMSRTVELKKGESIGGMMARGDENAFVALSADNTIIAQQNFGATPYFEPFQFEAPAAGTYEFILDQKKEGAPLFLDGVFVTQRFNQPEMRKPIKGKKSFSTFLGNRWLWSWRDTEWLEIQRTLYTKRWAFDSNSFPEGWRAKGRAFGKGPVFGRLGKQQQIRGPGLGGVLSSYHGGDRSTGSLRSDPFVLNGEPIYLLVAGGKNCKKVFVGLEVDNKIVTKRCGKNDETFRIVSLPTKRWKNKIARLIIKDDARKSWGHLLVDEIIIPSDQ